MLPVLMDFSAPTVHSLSPFFTGRGWGEGLLFFISFMESKL
jgi:hypothetical protein